MAWHAWQGSTVRCSSSRRRGEATSPSVRSAFLILRSDGVWSYSWLSDVKQEMFWQASLLSPMIIELSSVTLQYFSPVMSHSISVFLFSTAQMQPLRVIELSIMWCLYCQVLQIIVRQISFLPSYERTTSSRQRSRSPAPVYYCCRPTWSVWQRCYATYVRTYIHTCMRWGWRCPMN